MKNLLTDREREVLLLIAKGSSNKEISKHLNISVCTVQNHVQNILRKLSANNRTEASSIYWRDFHE
ncbi:MAG: response regulator transcription factor [Blastochloris sp.]|nr:response regulator transcription factor [Blastochloris sp.]